MNGSKPARRHTLTIEYGLKGGFRHGLHFQRYLR